MNLLGLFLNCGRYSADVVADIMALPTTLQARYTGLSMRMINSGAHLGGQHTKALGDGRV